MMLRLLALSVLASLAAGCVRSVQSPPPASGESVAVMEAPSPVVATPTDPHYLAPDDYLVRVSMNNDVAHVAKQLAAPTAPGGEGVFLSQRNSAEVRSTQFWLTRPANASDAVVGATLFCFEGNRSADEIRHAPRNVDEARGSLWVVDRVTDTSELAQGIVRIGRRSCGLDAVRAPLE